MPYLRAKILANSSSATPTPWLRAIGCERVRRLPAWRGASPQHTPVALTLVGIRLHHKPDATVCPSGGQVVRTLGLRPCHGAPPVPGR